MYKVQAIKEQERLNLGQKNYIANPPLSHRSLPNFKYTQYGMEGILDFKD